MIIMEEMKWGELSSTRSKRFNVGERTNHSKDQQMMKRHMLIHPRVGTENVKLEIL